MGSHSAQAVALTVFLLAATLMSAGLAMGNFILTILGLAGVAAAAVLFRRCKQLEESQT